MTGFARLDGSHDRWRWAWEVKSVNARGLEMRFRLPPGVEALEPALRAAAKARLKRGAVSVSLTMRSESPEARYRINEQALADAVAMVARVAQTLECAPPRPEGILALRGVIEPADETEDDAAREALFAALNTGFADALDALADARRSEGEAMAKVLTAQIAEVESLAKAASALADATPEAIRKKIAAQLAELLAGAAVPEDRLAQEAAVLALKADVREELDRLASHVAAGRALLQQAGPAGRQLDFLTQEFNREANTLCSKASDMELKRIGLDLKKVIDQMREQVQNIE